jgi:phage baseplate assembly protein W
MIDKNIEEKKQGILKTSLGNRRSASNYLSNIDN